MPLFYNAVSSLCVDTSSADPKAESRLHIGKRVALFVWSGVDGAFKSVGMMKPLAVSQVSVVLRSSQPQGQSLFGACRGSYVKLTLKETKIPLEHEIHVLPVEPRAGVVL